MKKSQNDGSIEINRTQFKILRHKEPNIYSIARIEVVGRGAGLKALLKPINEKSSSRLNKILKKCFPTIEIPSAS